MCLYVGGVVFTLEPTDTTNSQSQFQAERVKKKLNVGETGTAMQGLKVSPGFAWAKMS